MRDHSNSASGRAAGAGGREKGGGAWKGGAAGSTRNKKTSHCAPSVTSVVFIDEFVLASAGANDGAVKLWDLRKSWNSQVLLCCGAVMLCGVVWRSVVLLV